MLFSFIVPCYNTAQYLERCVESIIKQTHQDWEMILINDGSTDDTAKILQQYAKKDKRIKIFSQENQGLSAARNRGICEAVGDYILFLDSDDWYKDENCLDKIDKSCNDGNVEILVFQLNRVIAGKEYCENNNLQYFSDAHLTYTGEEFLNKVLGKDTLYRWYPCLYAFNREFWTAHQIKFDSKVRYYEDVNIIYQIILKAKRVAILKEAVYQYRVGRNGQLTQPSKESLYRALEVCKDNIDTVNTMGIGNELKILLNSNFAHTYLMVLTPVNYLEKKDQKDIYCFLKTNQYIMENITNKKDLLVVKIIRILGLHVTAKLLLLYSIWRK